MIIHIRIRAFSVIVLIAGLTGCSAPPAEAPSAPPLRLTAQLVTATDVALDWSGAPAAAGHVVEFATEPGGTYTSLDYLLTGTSQFHHPALVPETRFYYRVRPFHGPTSSPVDVVMPPPAPGEDIETIDHTWADARTLTSGVRTTTLSIRGVNVSPEAAPTDFKATTQHSRGVKFTWTDRASDEDGYFLEARPEGSPDFKVVALLDANVNSAGIMTLPDEKRAAYRVRAFYFGPSSNIVDKTTGPEAKRDTAAPPARPTAPKS